MGGNTTHSTAVASSTTPSLDSFMDNSSVSNNSSSNGSVFTQNDYVFAYALMPLSTFIIVGNILVLISAVAMSKFRNHVGYFFIANLAIADLLLGVVSTVSIFNILLRHSDENLATCILRIGLVVMSCAASVFTIACIAIDRCIAVNAALRYKEIVTPARALMGIAVTWVVAILYGFFPLTSLSDKYDNKCSFLAVLSKEYTLALFFAGFLPTVILIIVIYTSLCLVTRKQLKKINALDQIRRGSNQSTTAQLRSQRIKRNLKAIKTLALVIGTFFACWFPFFVAALVQVFCGEKCHLQDIVGTYLVLLGFLNSALNPAIYAYFNKDFRKSLRSLCCKNRVEPSEQLGQSVNLRRQSALSAREAGDFATIAQRPRLDTCHSVSAEEDANRNK
ncbi:glucose-dependent insulinotropic receptor-like [Branchiostoma floridae]|uniref:Glucose-dependent insulinotropic receptor-like n=1 Tax=Branchiostoma floridae TaxID=7739 RepID=A0A9J7LQA4_BRAFL|nr:glucose-dependent insulinotropic receptor-like [Branchiostoma floridae]